MCFAARPFQVASCAYKSHKGYDTRLSGCQNTADFIRCATFLTLACSFCVKRKLVKFVYHSVAFPTKVFYGCVILKSCLFLSKMVERVEQSCETFSPAKHRTGGSTGSTVD